MKLTKSLLLSNDTEELKKSQLYLLRKIPKEYFKPSSLKSWSYLAFDFAIVFLLAFAGKYAWDTSNLILGALYLFLQGSFFWSLFVIGHDSGHETFASRNWENLLSGYMTHSFVLVPFYSWKLSHHKHHAFHQCLEKDESYLPRKVSWLIQFQKEAANAPFLTKLKYLILGVFDKCCLVFIVYLISASPLGNRKTYSHYDINADLFAGKRKQILFSILGVVSMLSVLAFIASQTSVLFTIYIYFIPWIICNMWIFVVTYLQHTSDQNYWFYQKDWHFFKGAIQTIDYDYGKLFGPFVNFFHHNIQRYHFIHHLAANIPHYNLKKSHESIASDIEDIVITQSKPLHHLIKYKYRDKIRVIKDYVDGTTHYQRHSFPLPNYSDAKDN